MDTQHLSQPSSSNYRMLSPTPQRPPKPNFPPSVMKDDVALLSVRDEVRKGQKHGRRDEQVHRHGTPQLLVRSAAESASVRPTRRSLGIASFPELSSAGSCLLWHVEEL